MMAELHSPQYLPHNLLGSNIIQAIWISLKIIQDSVIYKLKHQEQPLLSSEYFYQIHQVVMSQLLENKF